ncbi:hypothetical protein AN1V17_37870 [Vallitalea sediminicola]
MLYLLRYSNIVYPSKNSEPQLFPIGKNVYRLINYLEFKTPLEDDIINTSKRHN